MNEQRWHLVREILHFIIPWLARRKIKCRAEHEWFLLHQGQGYSEPWIGKQAEEREEVTHTSRANVCMSSPGSWCSFPLVPARQESTKAVFRKTVD